MPLVKGSCSLVYDAVLPGDDRQSYINDPYTIEGMAGVLHFFGTPKKMS